jgi:drug/metabolite transporter (DMT)-like permease
MSFSVIPAKAGIQYGVGYSMNNQNKSAGILAMAATAFLWSIAGLFIKIIDWNPFAIAGVRSLIASIVIFVYLKHPRIRLSFPQIATSIANAATMLLFVSANKTTTAANAILLQYCAPVFTVFVSAIFLKERTRAEQFAAFPLVVAGMIFMFFDELGGGKLFGNVLAVMSAVRLVFILCSCACKKTVHRLNRSFYPTCLQPGSVSSYRFFFRSRM